MSEHQAEVIIQLLGILTHSLAGLRQESADWREAQGEVSE